MVEYTITKPISHRDFEELTRIRELAAIVTYSRPNGPSELEVSSHYASESAKIISNIQSRAHEARMLRVGKNAVAMCVWSLTDDKAKIEYLYTHPDYQKQGFGSALLEVALADIDGVVIELTTQNAQTFYEKWGFERTGRFVTDEITSEEIMVKRQ